MTDVHAFLAAAASEIGYVEQPTNRTKFAKEAGHANGAAWCQTFADAMAKRAGVRIPDDVAKTAYTPSAVNAWKKAGRWFTTPEPGDFAYFQFDRDPQVDHVGIVEKVIDKATIQTIEGNTSSGDHGSQSNGGGVYRRKRPRRLIVGYGRPYFMEDEVTDADIEKIAQRVYEKVAGDPLFGKRFTLSSLAAWTKNLVETKDK